MNKFLRKPVVWIIAGLIFFVVVPTSGIAHPSWQPAIHVQKDDPNLDAAAWFLRDHIQILETYKFSGWITPKVHWCRVRGSFQGIRANSYERLSVKGCGGTPTFIMQSRTLFTPNGCAWSTWYDPTVGHWLRESTQPGCTSLTPQLLAGGPGCYKGWTDVSSSCPTTSRTAVLKSIQNYSLEWSDLAEAQLCKKVFNRCGN